MISLQKNSFSTDLDTLYETEGVFLATQQPQTTRPPNHHMQQQLPTSETYVPHQVPQQVPSHPQYHPHLPNPPAYNPNTTITAPPQMYLSNPPTYSGIGHITLHKTTLAQGLHSAQTANLPTTSNNANMLKTNPKEDNGVILVPVKKPILNRNPKYNPHTSLPISQQPKQPQHTAQMPQLTHTHTGGSIEHIGAGINPRIPETQHRAQPIYSENLQHTQPLHTHVPRGEVIQPMQNPLNGHYRPPNNPQTSYAHYGVAQTQQPGGNISSIVPVGSPQQYPVYEDISEGEVESGMSYDARDDGNNGGHTVVQDLLCAEDLMPSTLSDQVINI
jgi:hypothetical protein